MSDVETKQLLEVLKFYANEDNYVFNPYGRGTFLRNEDLGSVVEQDLGERARELLSKLSIKE